MQVPEEDDGEGGADEVCEEGEDALGDEDVHDCLFGHAFSGNAEVIDFVHGDALEDFEEEEGEVGDYEEGDEAVEGASQFVELGEAEEEEADGDLAGCEGEEELSCVEVVVFEEVPVLFNGEIRSVLSQAVADFGHHKSFTYGCNHLLSFDKHKFMTESVKAQYLSQSYDGIVQPEIARDA